MTDEIAKIVAGLSDAQREAVLRIGDDVILASVIGENIGTELFDMGIISKIIAVYFFTNLTPLGLAVRAALLKGPTE